MRAVPAFGPLFVLCLGVFASTLTSGQTLPSATAEASSPLLPASVSVFRKMALAAIEAHPATRAAQARLDSARFGVSEAEWARYPSLSTELSRNDAGDQFHRLQLQQPLWAGGRIEATIASSGAKAVGATAAVRETRMAVAEQIAQTAVELRKSQVQIGHAEESLTGYQKLLDAIERRADGGLGLQSDVTLARSRIALANANLAQLQANERRLVARWISLTGAPPGTFDIASEDNTALATLRVDDLVAEALAFSPALARQRAEVEVIGFDRDATLAAAWPQLSLRAIRTFERGANVSNETQYLAVLEYQPGAGLGVLDRSQAVGAQQAALTADIAKLERDIEEQVRAAHADLRGLSERVSALNEAGTANAEIIQSFLRQYNIGKRSWLDVLNAQREWTDSIQQSIETRYNALAAAYRLEVITGRFFRE